MTVGSPSTSSLEAARGHPGLRFVCLQNKATRFPELPSFPDRPCIGGIMTVHHFPACWDGKNLDSPDHQSHMYNTNKEAFINAGPCPASHPVRVPQVAYETLWDTTQFNSMWPAGAPNPFVLSFGDQNGWGTHADYLFGWKGDSLQRAMDSSCMFQGCENGRPLKSQGVAAMNRCQVKDMVGEELDGCKFNPESALSLFYLAMLTRIPRAPGASWSGRRLPAEEELSVRRRGGKRKEKCRLLKVASRLSFGLGHNRIIVEWLLSASTLL